jgi:hypothetical protein
MPDFSEPTEVTRPRNSTDVQGLIGTEQSSEFADALIACILENRWFSILITSESQSR